MVPVYLSCTIFILNNYMGSLGKHKYDIKIGDIIGHYSIKSIDVRNITIQCECGSKPRIVDIWYAVSSGRKCVECGNQQLGSANATFKGYKEIRGDWPTRLNKKNLEGGYPTTDIDFEYLWDLFIKQNKKCNLSGLKLTFHGEKSEWGYERTASLDRINSKIGYLKGNVQWVHKHVNHMKNKYDHEYFIKICKLIAKKNK